MASARKKIRAKKVVDDEDGAKAGAIRPDEMPEDVIEFITAIDGYKRLHRRPFPTWSEVLEVLKGLGYARSSR